MEKLKFRQQVTATTTTESSIDNSNTLNRTMLFQFRIMLALMNNIMVYSLTILYHNKEYRTSKGYFLNI